MLAWYRRYHLLVNLPVLLLITELVLTRTDLVNRAPFSTGSDLDYAFARYDEARPSADERVVVLLGNSSVRVGIDQHIVEAGLQAKGKRARVYNFGLNTLRTGDGLALSELLLERGIKPAVIVLGVNPFLVDDEVNPDTRYPWLARRSPYVYFHRSRLRSVIKKRITRLAKGEKQRPYQQFVLKPPQTVKERTAEIIRFIDEFSGRSPDDYPLLDELPGLISSIENHGIAVRVVMMPINPVGTVQVPALGPLMAAIRARVPASTFDVAERYPDAQFDDIGHLNATGRERLSRELVGVIEETLR